MNRERFDPHAQDLTGLPVRIYNPGTGEDVTVGVITEWSLTEKREIRAIAKISDPKVIDRLVPGKVVGSVSCKMRLPE